MYERLIGIVAMVFGFVGLIIENYGGAFCCFGFAFILLCVTTIEEYIGNRKKKDTYKDHTAMGI